MRTIVGLFDIFADAQALLHDLEADGFDRDDISVVAQGDRLYHDRDAGTATGAGTAIGAGLGLLAGLAAIAVPGVGALAVIGPMIAGGLVGAMAGGLVGALVDAGVPAHEAEYLTEGVRRGGTLVSIKVSNDDAPRAIEIFAHHRPVDLKERALQWRQTGWTPVSKTEPARAETEPQVEPNAPIESTDTAEEVHPSAASLDNALGGTDFHRMVDDFRSDFEARFVGTGYDWVQCQPAYREGYELAGEGADSDWNIVEPQARLRWEQQHPGTWDRMKDAMHYAFDRAKQKT